MSKKLTIIAILFILAASGGYMLATSNPFSWNNGLVGYWSFDGQYTTSTDGTKDVSNTGNYGQFKNGVKPTAGVVGQALSFNGVDSYVSVADSNFWNFGNDDFSISVWVKFADITDRYQSLVGQFYAGSNDWIIQSDFNAGSEKWKFYRNNVLELTSDELNLDNNVWYHFAFVRASGTMTFYMNGNTKGSGSVGLIDNSPDVLEIGARTNSFNGLIDEVRIYNRALSANEVKQHYDQTKRNFVAASSVPSSWWTSGLVGYWNFDGKNTTSTNGTRDTSGNNNWGTFSGGVGVSGGISGQALSFDGVNDLVSVADSSTLTNTATLTIEAWFNVSDLSSTRTIVGKGTSDADEEYTLIIASTYIYFDVGGNSGPYTQTTYTVTTNVWHHVVATHTRSGGSSTLKVYLDGVDLNSTTIGPTLTVGDNSTALTIGSRFAAGNAYFKGLIDEVRIYNRALSASEVKQHYEQTRRNFVAASSVPSSWWTSGLVGYWNFDGKNTTSTNGTRDTSGNNNWGTFNGGVRPVGGISGQALSFDGTDDYVDVNDSATLTSTNALTIAVWAKPNILSNWRDLVGKGTTDTNKEYGLALGATQIWFSVGTGSGPYIQQAAPLVAGKWHFIVATHSRSGGTSVLKLYVDGVDIGGTTGGPTVAPNDNTLPLMIGYSGINSPSYFNGLIDEVRIYNRALSADEIMQHYQQTRRNLRI